MWYNKQNLLVGMGIINIKGGETLKKKQYKQSKFKYLLINSRDLSHKLFSLNEDQKELALRFGFEIVPVLFEVRTQRSFTGKPRNYLLRILDTESRKGNSYRVMKLTKKEQDFLVSKGIPFNPKKYRLVK